MYRNFKYSSDEYKTINTVLYAYFVARVVFFFAVFGSLYSDLALFTGLVGLSVSLNGGVRHAELAPKPQFVFPGTGLAPESTATA
jgi:hypothetical protein